MYKRQERDGCHGTWFVSGDKRSLRMDWQGGQRGNYAEFLRRPGFPPTCDNVGSSYGFMRSWSLTLRGGVARQEMNRVGGPPDLTTIFDRTKYPNGGPRHDQDPCGVTVQAWPCMVLCPLSCLAMHGCADLVDCLTSLPCKFIPCSEYDPNAMNPLWFCSQAMGWAATFGQLHTVMVLAKNGADLDRVNLAGFNARSDAEREGHQHIVRWYDEWVALGKPRNCPALPF